LLSPIHHHLTFWRRNIPSEKKRTLLLLLLLVVVILSVGLTYEDNLCSHKSPFHQLAVPFSTRRALLSNSFGSSIRNHYDAKRCSTTTRFRLTDAVLAQESLWMMMYVGSDAQSETQRLYYNTEQSHSPPAESSSKPLEQKSIPCLCRRWSQSLYRLDGNFPATTVEWRNSSNHHRTTFLLRLHCWRLDSSLQTVVITTRQLVVTS
jgi:hypothetical protein